MVHFSLKAPKEQINLSTPSLFGKPSLPQASGPICFLILPPPPGPISSSFLIKDLTSLAIASCQTYQTLANTRDLIGPLPKGACGPDRQGTGLSVGLAGLVPDIPISSFAI